VHEENAGAKSNCDLLFAEMDTWTKIALGEDLGGLLSMELSAPPSLPTSPASLLLKSRVRVFHAIPNPTRPPFQASIFSPNQRNLTPIHLPRNVSSAAVVGDNASATTPLPIDSGQYKAQYLFSTS